MPVPNPRAPLRQMSVGEKTAIALLEKFGTLDAIYQNIYTLQEERPDLLLVLFEQLLGQPERLPADFERIDAEDEVPVRFVDAVDRPEKHVPESALRDLLVVPGDQDLVAARLRPEVFEERLAEIESQSAPVAGVDGQEAGHQFRPDNPRSDPRGRSIKYESPRGAANHLDLAVLLATGVPPRYRSRPSVRAVLRHLAKDDRSDFIRRQASRVLASLPEID